MTAAANSSLQDLCGMKRHYKGLVACCTHTTKAQTSLGISLQSDQHGCYLLIGKYNI